MGTELQVTAENEWVSIDVMGHRINQMHELMRRVMKPDNHYGVIPGCRQNSLFQPGSQLLSLTFKIGHEPIVEDLSTHEEVRYRVTDRVFDQKTGITITHGVGECSSLEEKYAWRRAVNNAEFEATDPSHRRIKYTCYNGKDGETQQIRTNPRDVANTVLKMARKRANVNGTIEALAASDLFTQDVEDLPEGMDLDPRRPAPSPNRKPSVAMPQEAHAQSQNQPDSAGSQPADTSGGHPSEDERKAKAYISEKQEKRLYVLIEKAGLTVDDVKIWLKLQHKKAHFYEISWKNKEYDTVCSKIESSGAEIKKLAEAVRNKPAPQAPAPESPAPASAAPVIRTAKDVFITSMTDIAASKNLSEQIDNILYNELGYSVSDMPDNLFEQALKVIKAY